MKTKIEEWSIEKLSKNLVQINAQPLYQRGKVWTRLKSQLLIESILRGIDIPKIYLRQINRNGYTYEVADGQQRLNAIQEFLNNEISLPKGTINGLQLSRIAGNNLELYKFSDIKKDYPEIKRFFEKEYKITIAIIEEATNAEIRTLFGRLQEGSKLCPAEKRNAILSAIGDHIDNFKFNHPFFEKCKISPTRFRHQDYLAHVFALIIYKNQHDLKSNLLEKLYTEKLSILPPNFIENFSVILDKMEEVETFSKVKIKNKFSFIDVFYYLFSNLDKIDEIDSKKLASFYDSLEKKRIESKNAPEKLIGDKVWGKPMYQYIIAYTSVGYTKENINTRVLTFSNLFEKQKK